MSPTVPVALGARQTLVRRERLLPTQGEVLVAKGRTVRPDDVVAKGERLRLPFALPVALLLGEEGRDVSAHLLKRPGEEVGEGEIVAAKKGLFGRTAASCRSPEAGVVLDFRPQDGLLIVRPKGDDVEVCAGLAGKIAGIVPERGVVVETAAIQAHGLALVGGEVWGPLRVGSDRRDGLVVVGQEAAGCVVFGGRADADALKRARSAGAKAVVVGGVDADAWHSLRAGGFAGLAVMVMEGVGSSPLSERTFQLLREAAGRQALLSPAADFGQRPLRPELVISLHGPAQVSSEAVPRLEIGAEVRICAGPRCGCWGKVASLNLTPIRLVGNIACPAAEVVLDDGATATVALANLELVG